MTINQKLIDDIESYCKINDMDVNDYVNKLLRKAFNEDRYGTMPEILNKKRKFVTESPEEDKAEMKNEDSTDKEEVNEFSNNIKLVTKKTRRKLNE